MRRESGILLPITSLPSPYGIGCFSREAYEFIDYLKKAGQSYWQILPLGPTSYGDSPYQSFSTFAGNPYFISLEDLIEEGVLTREECAQADPEVQEDSIDYAKLYEERYPLLRLAYERSDISKNADFVRFCQENDWWLSDYALFIAVKARFGGKAWTKWAQDIRLRWGNALDYYRRELYFDIEFHKYLQFTFFKQWSRLKAYANRQGIRIIGDIPIYVAMDSADAWANPSLFQLDENNRPLAVAGCPPDGFSATGQLWGNPSTTGNTTEIPATAGGLAVWPTATASTMWCASTISEALTNISTSRQTQMTPLRDTGKKARESSSFRRCGMRWEKKKSLPRIWAM